MKRLNEKGFAIAGVLYTLLVIFLGLIFYFLLMLSNRKNILDKIKENVYKDISGIVTEELTISFEQIPNLMVEGSSYNLKENYINTSNKQANITCAANDVEIENTSILTPGNYTLACTIEIGNTSDYVEKEVAVIEKGTHIYYNPVTNKVCEDYNESNSATGVNSGCMKWYIYADSDKNRFNMILDHNTSGNVAWNSSGVNTNGTGEVQERLEFDTAGWNKNLNARLITADEIAHITGADVALSWSSNQPLNSSAPVIGSYVSWFYLDGSNGSDATWHTQISKTQGSNKFYWLFDNISGCASYGCKKEDNNLYSHGTIDSSNTSVIGGYWTSTAIVGDSYINYAWDIDKEGALGGYMIGTVSGRGVRPVITVNKSDTNILCDSSSNRVCKWRNTTNVIVNGSFEDDGNNWKLGTASSSVYEGQIVTGQYVTGSKSLYIFDDSNSIRNWSTQAPSLNQNHKYYLSSYVKYESGSDIGYVGLMYGGAYRALAYTVNSTYKEWTKLSLVNALQDETTMQVGTPGGNIASYYIDDIILIDLTETFGSGNEPSKEWCDQNIKWFNGSKEIFW